MIIVSKYKKNIDSLLFAALGFIIIFVFTRHGGIGIEPDSVVYFSAADNLHVHGTLTDYMNKPVVEFPALYPAFLCGISIISGLSPIAFAPLLNALLFAVIIFLSGWIMEYFLFRSVWYKRAILSCIVLSPGLLEVYSMMWSETLFILLIFLFLIAMHQYFQSYSRKMLIVVAVIASLASITRYAGIVIIATGGILLLLDMKMPWRRKIINLFFYAVISPLPLIVNLIRNYTAGGSMTGMRQTSITSLSKNLHDVGSVFYDWLPFLHGHYSGSAWLMVCVLAALAWLCLRQFFRTRRITTYEDMATWFSFIYLLFIVAIASVSRFEPLNARFLSPAFIPLLWSGTTLLSAVYSKVSVSLKKSAAVLAAVIFLCFQYGQVNADYETWDGIKDEGIPGYTEDSWKYSQTVQFIQHDSLQLEKGYTIYSNANDAIYFFTRHVGKFLPRKEIGSDVQDFLHCRHCYVVLFNDGDDPELFSIDSLINVKKMRLLKQFSDGAIYSTDE
jgi:hypothetical protein